MKRFCLFAVLILVVMCFVSCATSKASGPEADGKLHVRFFSVDGVDQWGDCTYIVLPDGQNMIIDLGYQEAGDIVADELLASGVNHIDYVIFSHCHSDHWNGFASILDKGITVGKVYSNGYIPTNYYWALQRMEKANIPHEFLRCGDSFQIGDVSFDVLWPMTENLDFANLGATNAATTGTGSNLDINCSSLVFRMQFGDFSILFTGDIYKEAEAQILEKFKDDLSVLDCTVLKIMHHGKNTSSSKEFINAVAPEVAVSMGTANMIASVYTDYYMMGTKVYFSWMNGNVYIDSDGVNYEVRADSEEISAYYQGVEKLAEYKASQNQQ